MHKIITDREEKTVKADDTHGAIIMRHMDFPTFQNWAFWQYALLI